MSYKMASYDLDGTLINDDQSIASSAIEAIKGLYAIGVENVITTGRSFHLIPKSLLRMPELRYFVTSSGARLYDTRDRRTEFLGDIPIEEVEGIIKIVHRYGGSALVFFHEAAVYEKSILNPYRTKVIEHCRREKNESINIVDDILSNLEHFGCAEKMVIEFESENIGVIISEISEFGRYEFVSDGGMIEINHVGVSKEYGLEKVCEKVGINMRQVIAFGDSVNDISMLIAAGCGVAMGNADKDVKESANFVTKAIDEDGIAYAISKLF